jgi:hypothetical protein
MSFEEFTEDKWEDFEEYYDDMLDSYSGSYGGYSGGTSRKMPKASTVIAIILAVTGIACLIFGNSGIQTLGIFMVIYPVGYVLVILLKGIAGLIVSFLRLLLKALPFIIGIGVLALIIYLVF